MGARQVGKTWLMRDFGKRNFAAVHEFNFDDNPDLARVFAQSKDPGVILPQLSILSGRKIDIENDVVIFDEIQDCGNALNSLKYFYGHFVENYVLQQLAGRTEGNVHYWAERAESEIDFVIQMDGEAVPIEVKSGTDRKCAAFKSFVNNRHPRYAIRFSALNLKRDGAFVNIPLYLVPRFSACL